MPKITQTITELRRQIASIRQSALPTNSNISNLRNSDIFSAAREISGTVSAFKQNVGAIRETFNAAIPQISEVAQNISADLPNSQSVQKLAQSVTKNAGQTLTNLRENPQNIKENAVLAAKGFASNIASKKQNLLGEQQGRASNIINEILTNVRAVKENSGVANITREIGNFKQLPSVIKQKLTEKKEVLREKEQTNFGVKNNHQSDKMEILLRDMLNVLTDMRDGERAKQGFEKSVIK